GRWPHGPSAAPCPGQCSTDAQTGSPPPPPGTRSGRAPSPVPPPACALASSRWYSPRRQPEYDCREDLSTKERSGQDHLNTEDESSPLSPALPRDPGVPTKSRRRGADFVGWEAGGRMEDVHERADEVHRLEVPALLRLLTAEDASVAL